MKKFIFTLSEALSGTYTSQLQFIGTTGGNGLDNTNTHVYPLTGSDLNAGDHEIDVSSDVTLVDGSEYSVQYKLYDAAGNATNNTN